MIYIICLALVLLMVLLAVGWRVHITSKNKKIDNLSKENNDLNTKIQSINSASKLTKEEKVDFLNDKS